jgi:16S rRNA (guanine527-N7)-methyltransferase
MEHLSNSLIEDTLTLYNTVTTPALCDQIRTYIDLLLRWNQKTSLTTVTDPEEILRFHFGESMLAAAAVPIRHGRLADVGTGAGFPAVPLRMVSDDLNVILIESNQKKATFLAELARELHLSRVDIRRCRMENIDLSGDPVDFVTARALGIDGKYLKWSDGALKSQGSVVLWLGEADSARISKESGWKWSDPLLIPHSERRFILRGAKP